MALLERLGASHVIAAGPEGNFADAVAAATGGRGADLVIDHVGGPWLAETLRCAAPYARIVNIGRLGDGKGELDLDALALKRARVIGSTFRIRDEEEIGRVVADLRAELGSALAAGELRPLLDSSFPIEQVEAAQERMARDDHLGKIVLELSS